MGLIKRMSGAAPVAPPRPARNFAGAVINRLTASLSTASNSVNSDLDGALAILRARARNLCANYEFGKRFLSLVGNNVIGPHGPMLQVRRLAKGKIDKPMNDAVETHWMRWAARCDITGRMNLARLLSVAVKGVARDGEALIRLVRDRRLPYGLGLQLLEPDRLDETYNTRLQNGNFVRQGVELDSDLRPVAYHVWTMHPGENYVGVTPTRARERVPAADMYHLFLPERAEQVRGYSWLHAILLRANMLSGLEEAALVATRVGASKMGVFTRSEESGGGSGDTSALAALAESQPQKNTLQMSAEPGEFIDLTGMPGVGLETWNPDYPHENFESFVKQCLRGLASGLDVATHNLSGDMTEVNYSSARIAELSERDMWTGVQAWLINMLLTPLYSEWLGLGLLKGDITFANGNTVPTGFQNDIYLNSRFQGRRWSWVDPYKEAQAATQLIQTGLASRTEIAASQGREFDDIAEELAQEKTTLDGYGLKADGATTSPPPPAPKQKEDTDE